MRSHGLIIQGDSVHNSNSVVILDFFFIYTQSIFQIDIYSQLAAISPPCLPSGRESLLAEALLEWRMQLLQQSKHYAVASPSSAPWSPSHLTLPQQEGKAASKRSKRRSKRRGETGRENLKPVRTCTALRQSCGC